jgi:hypothetical protein
MSTERFYTTQLQAGLGVIEETKILLDLWTTGMNTPELFELALQSGTFPNVSARRLRNIIAECFAPRYLNANGCPASLLKNLLPNIKTNESTQLFYIYTCRANIVLADFIKEIFWAYYSSGQDVIKNEDAQKFVIKANREGKMAKPWSDTTLRRVASYLTGSCADFGLLETGRRNVRKIRPFRIEPIVALFLAYDLHFLGFGDNSIISHSDWALFGMDPSDVIETMKQLSLRGYFIIQTAADITCISWKYKSWEELIHAISKG